MRHSQVWYQKKQLYMSWLDLSWLEQKKFGSKELNPKLPLPGSRKNFVSENCPVQENIGIKIFGSKEIWCPKILV